MGPDSSDNIYWKCECVFEINEYNNICSFDFDEFYSRVKMLFDFNILEIDCIEIPDEDEFGDEYMNLYYSFYYNS